MDIIVVPHQFPVKKSQYKIFNFSLNER